MGTLYEHGQGVEQNYKSASIWYEKAAEKGHPKAQFNLGGLYYLGLGVKQDYSKCYKWLTRAAKKITGENQEKAELVRNKCKSAIEN